MQKTLIKSLLAVAVAGTFATVVNAANLPKQATDYVNSTGAVVPEAIHENFVFLNAGLTTAQGRLDGHDTAITDHGTRLDGHDTRLTAAEGTLTDHENRLTTAEGKVTTLEGSVAGLDTRLTTAESDILNNKNNITSNSTRLTTAEGTLTDHENRLTTAEGKVTTLEGKVTTAEGRLDGHDTRLNGHDTRLTDAEGRLDGHDTRLTTAEGRIDINSHAIAENYKEMKNNFAAVNSRIDKLDDKMKKGFASQAALNGLFQPYNVGKFNVSAAIGGYDSEQAMALGAGYRFNENFAIKAGIASDLSGFDHVTYNVGANFEF